MKARAASPLLDAATLAGIGDLQLVARAVVEGFLAGLHASRRLAVGAEFSQYRPYAPGDDPRGIDWRLHARTDRYFLRQAHSERDVVVRFVLDASASMAVPGEGAGGGAGKSAMRGGRAAGGADRFATHGAGAAGGGGRFGAHGARAAGGAAKFATARLAAAALAYLAHLQGDAVALEVVGGVGGGGAAEFPGDAGKHLGRGSRRGVGGVGGITGFLHELERVVPGGAWPAAAELVPRLTARRGKELVLVLSDLWERGAEMREALGALRALRQEVLVLRVLAPEEIELPPGEDALFEDSETGERVAVRGGATRRAYAERFAAHRAALRRDLLALGVAFEELRTDEPLDGALREFLLRRRLLP
jgi:uncharacterized protein (DUF58 family)